MEKEVKSMSLEEITFRLLQMEREVDRLTRIVIGEAPEFQNSLVKRVGEVEEKLDPLQESIREVNELLKRVYSQTHIALISIFISLFLSLAMNLFLK